MIKAVIFDMDGTVTDTLSTIAYFGNVALSKNGFPEIPEEKYKYFAGNGKKILIRRMLEYIDSYDDINYNRVEKTYDEAYGADVIGKTTVFDGIIPLLDELHKMGIKTAVNSNKPDDVVQKALKILFPKGTIDKTYGQIDGMPIKPDPTIALRLCEGFDAKPNECLFVGDTSVDMETGNNAGMHTVGVLWGFRTIDELKDSGAEFIVSTPFEIIDSINSLKTK